MDDNPQMPRPALMQEITIRLYTSELNHVVNLISLGYQALVSKIVEQAAAQQQPPIGAEGPQRVNGQDQQPREPA